MGDILYFNSNSSGPIGDELYKTDGTPDSTVLVGEIFPGGTPIGSGDPSFLSAVNGHLVFTGYRPDVGTEVWSIPTQSTDTTPVDTTGIADRAGYEAVQCYPKPAGAYVTVAATSDLASGTTATVTVFNYTGSPVLRQRWNSPASQALQLELTSLAHGLYLLQIDTGTNTYWGKVVKQ